jgi:O-methyltransferase
MTRSSIDLSQETIDYLIANNYDETDTLAKCRQETANHPRANYQISQEQGNFMAFLTRLNDSRIAVEIGVFTGYSALVTIGAMVKNAGPSAKLFALDMSHEYLAIAQEYWQMAKLDKYISPMAGDAKASLEKLIEMGYTGRIDQIFIDADKANYPIYFEYAHKLLRKSGLLLVDNMFLSGRAINPKDDDKQGAALNQFAKDALIDKRFEICLTSVGDGILMAKKN